MSTIFREIEGQLDQIPVSRETVEAFLARMEQDLRTSEKLRKEDPAWALAIAHQAIHNGCAALMAAHGYRARVDGHHWTAIRSARLALPKHAALLRRAEHLRRMRHRTVYGGIHTPSQSDVDAALSLARRLAAVLAKAARAALTRKPGEEPSKK